MKKNGIKLLIIFLIILICIITFITVKKNRVTNDEKSFKKEYERYNGYTNPGSDKKYFDVNIEEKNGIIFANPGSISLPKNNTEHSYLIIDEKITLIDGVDELVVDEWLANIEKVLNGKAIDYLVVQHMETDHSASIFALMKKHILQQFQQHWK